MTARSAPFRSAPFPSSAAERRGRRRYEARCACTRRVEAARARLHASLSKVLLIDARMSWNGVGNSLVRWLALLRFGTAAGRATFLWMSDRDSPTALLRPPNASAGRRLAAARVPRDESAPVSAYPRSSGAPARAHARHVPQRPNGFDLGDYFVAEGGDFRWSRGARRRVAKSLAARGLNLSSALLVTYFCRHHTWACMQPSLEWGAMDAAMAEGGAGLDAGYASAARRRIDVNHDREHDGALLAWMAAREEPWIVLRMRHEQTGLQPSAAAAGAVLSGLWRQYGAPPLGTDRSVDTVGARVGWRGRAADGTSRAQWRQLRSTAAASPWMLAAERASAAPRDAPSSCAAPPRSRALAAACGLTRPRDACRLSSHCEAYALLRPRRWLQRRLEPYLAQFDRKSAVVGLHMRTGFADWQYYSSSASRKALSDGTVQSQRSWHAAATAPLMPFAQHWQTFETMLYDCNEPKWTRGNPCFNWRRPTQGAAPTVDAALTHCNKPAPPAGVQLRMPSNGTLAAAVLCASRYGRALSKSNASDDWALFVLGDAPGFSSLVAALPGLESRVIHTNRAGVTGHTSFAATCAHGTRTTCLPRGTVDPGGSWTRSIIDFYLGGLVDGFVSVLFSSFVGAMLSRSLTCCSARMHFGAMYTQQYSHRDRPMKNVAFLRAMMQSEEQDTEPSRWGEVPKEPTTVAMAAGS
ncbi:hypothetical protein AB1Y20_015340 [Prymnesium parvum]|uniref:Protein xylosyltransferase n=1 Tax=Prymnesium parvum TaxID=97485 RepID=A0AB34K174_PRYPA